MRERVLCFDNNLHKKKNVEKYKILKYITYSRLTATFPGKLKLLLKKQHEKHKYKEVSFTHKIRNH